MEICAIYRYGKSVNLQEAIRYGAEYKIGIPMRLRYVFLYRCVRLDDEDKKIVFGVCKKTISSGEIGHLRIAMRKWFVMQIVSENT